jgi:hypothetical protein
VRSGAVSVNPPSNLFERWNDFWFGYTIEMSRLIMFRFILYGVSFKLYKVTLIYTDIISELVQSDSQIHEI